jgi:hypothetical protein
VEETKVNKKRRNCAICKIFKEIFSKEWADFIFKCSTNQRMLNLSPWENIMKLRSCLIYGKSKIDEKTFEFRLPIKKYTIEPLSVPFYFLIYIENFRLVDLFVTNTKQNIESERQHIIHMLQSVGLPSDLVFIIKKKLFS